MVALEKKRERRNVMKSTKRLLQVMIIVVAFVIVCFSIALFATPSGEQQPTGIETTTSEPTTAEEATTELVTEEKTTVQVVSAMVEQFKSLGFTQKEAEKVEKIFKTVGITEISNIQAVGNNGIDKLQAFKCDIFDSQRDKGGPSLLFTVEKRQLCHISLNGFKNSLTLQYDSIVLYDIWNEDGTINKDAIGYKNVVDYENGKITKYEP